MKNMKKSLLALALVSMTASVLPDDGGAWLGGTAIGLGTGLMIGSSMNRRNEDPATTTVKGINKEIRYNQTQINKAHTDLRRGRISQDEHDSRVAEYKDNIKSLNRQRQMAAA